MTLSRSIRRIWRYCFPNGGLKAFRRLEDLGFAGNIVRADGAQRVQGRIEFNRATGNTLEIGDATDFIGVILVRGRGNRIQIGRGCKIRGRITVKGDNQRVVIGDQTSCAGVYILAQENCDVLIGSHCMFSRDVEIRTSDSHSVLERGSLKRSNTPASVVIGNHVWLGFRSIVSKGARIPEDSIVGAAAFVNKSFDEPGIVLAGAPARIVKRNITWHRKRKACFTQDELDIW